MTDVWRAGPGANVGLGWAGASLERSLRTGLLAGIALWLGVVIAVIGVSSEADERRVPLILLHLALVVLAVLARADRVPVPVVAAGVNIALLVNWATADAVDSVLTFATAWLCNIANLLPAILMQGKVARASSIAIGLVVPGGLYLAHPDWLATLVVPAIVTGFAIRSVGRLGLGVLVDVSHQVDRQIAATWSERRALAIADRSSAEAGEQARRLHDTVINTLAAVASGGGAVRDAAAVRAHCARDVRALDELLEGGSTVGEVSLERWADELGLRLRRSGMDASASVAALDDLPASVRGAIDGAVREAVRNVAKHAGTDAVEVAVEVVDGTLRVSVHDDGCGFDGQVIPGRGLAASVVQRAEAAAVDVTIESALGRGTTITLTHRADLAPSGREVDETSGGGVEATVASIRSQASLLWVAGVVAVGIAIEAFNRFGTFSPTYVMLLLVAVGGLAARHDLRARRSLGPTTTALLVVSVPAAFLAALAGVDYGREEVVLWQAIGVTGPIVLLLVHGRTIRPLVLALAAMAVAAGAATATVARDSVQVAAVIPVGAAAAFGVAGGWVVFHRAIDRIGRRVAEERRALEAVRIDHGAREAADAARERWRQAGLAGCRSLLERLAAGEADPEDRAVRAACTDEEAYLRQLTMLDPALRRMGRWFARALAAARASEVHLVVRAGGHDVDEDADAAHLGSLLERAVSSAPPGSDLTVSLLPEGGRLRLGLVGAAPNLADAAAGWPVPATWRLAGQRYGGVDLVEVVHAPTEPSSDATPAEDHASLGGHR